MKRLDPKARWLAAGLSALAGYVDALGFIAMGGFFVSFMSGNSTRLAVGLAGGSANAVVAGALIGLFIVGVILGSIIGRLTEPRRSPAVVALVATLLALAALSATLGARPPAIALMVLAMGAENAVFEEDGEVRIGLTYMTGTLVKMGQGLAGALFGEDRWAWTSYFLLWAGLVAGAVAGAVSYAALGLHALWIAAVAAAVLALATARITPP